MPEDSAPQHHSPELGDHEIILARTQDDHQNPYCMACGQHLNLREFEEMTQAGLVVR